MSWTTFDDEGFWDQAPTANLQAVVAAGAATGARTSVFPLGDPADAATPTVVLVRVPAGGRLPHLGHGRERLDAVLAGSLRAGDTELGAGAMARRGPEDPCSRAVAGEHGATVLQYLAGLPRVTEDEDGAGDEGWESTGDPGFWNRVPAPRLEPLVAPFRAGPPNSPYGYRMFTLGDPGSDETPTAVAFKAGRRYVLDRHAHDCWRWEIVIDGTVETETGDVLPVGGIMTAPPGQLYGPFRAGPEGYTVIEIFSRLTGAHEITWDREDGLVLDHLLGDPS